MKKTLLNEVRRFQKIAGILKEDYRSEQDNLTIIQRCIELGNKNPKWNELKQAAIEAYEEYNEYHDRSQLDSAVEDMLDFYQPPLSVIPYETPDEDSRGMLGRGLRSEMELGSEPDQLEEDDYDMGTPSGDTDAMNIAEDGFSATMHAVEDDPVV